MCDLCRTRRNGPDVEHATPRTAAAASHPVLALQRAAGNRAVGRLLQRENRRPPAWIPSSPTLDIGASVMQQAFTSQVRGLTRREHEVGERVYGASIDLRRVRIGYSTTVATPTTLGDTIRTETEMSDETLVHELMHVWQHQTQGLGYISCSLAAQTVGHVAHGDRNWAYEYDLPGPETRLSDYSPEQQAMLVEDAFRLNRLEGDPVFGRVISEVRRARPRPGGARAAIADRAGLGGPSRDDPFRTMAPDPRSEEMGGTVPQLQWRF
jgi:hypothetical protein